MFLKKLLKTFTKKKGKSTNEEIPAKLELKLLNDDTVIPSKAHDGDIGIDLTAISVEYDAVNDVYQYHTGIAVATDKKYGVFLYPRSSNRRTDCYLANSVAVIDSYLYRGELIVCFKNRTSFAERMKLICLEDAFLWLLDNIKNNNTYKKLQDTIDLTKSIPTKNINPMDFAPYKVGERICQMVILKTPETNIEVVKKLNDTVRGTGGFGSSGK